MRKLLVLMFPVLIMAACTNCGAVKDQARATASTVIDCTKAEAAAAIATYAPTLEQVLLGNADGAGRLDLDSVKAATKGYATSAAKCVIASTIARLLAPPAISPDAPQSSPLVIDPGDLATLRADLLGSVEYRL